MCAVYVVIIQIQVVDMLFIALLLTALQLIQVQEAFMHPLQIILNQLQIFHLYIVRVGLNLILQRIV